MSALTGDVILTINGLLRKQIPYVITNGVQVYVGGLAELASGYVTNFATTGTVLGIFVGPGVPGNNPVMDGFTLTSPPLKMIAPGNASTAAAGNANQAVVETGEVTVMRVPIAVAGTLAGTQADVGTVLYAVTNNISDAVTTQPGSDKPLGEIVNFYSASGGTAYYDILVYSYEARKAM